MEKILITGATGMLGGYVKKFIDNTKYEIFCPKRSEFDLKKIDNIAKIIKDFKPNIILHLAAETNVDLCEVDIAHAAQVNYLATQEIAKTASEIGAWMVYISTSNVFGADKKLSYNELDLPCPLNYYGKSKLAGEEGVKKYLAQNSLIVRSGWMIGGGAQRDQKFVGKIIAQIRNKALVLKAVDDKYGTVTFACALAKFIIDSMKIRKVGLYHFASQGLVTRFDIANLVARNLNFQGELKPVKSSEFPLSAPRPDSEGISSVLLNDKEGIKPILNDLKEYINDFDIVNF